MWVGFYRFSGFEPRESVLMGTLFEELAERRSRSSELNALAIEQGVPVFVAKAQVSEDDVEAATVPEMDGVAVDLVGENPIQLPVAEVIEAAAEELDVSDYDPFEVAAAETVSDDKAEAGEEAGSAVAREEEADASGSSFEDLPEAEPETEPAQLTPNELIAQSEDLLGVGPEAIEDAEVIMAAEDIVDRIGSVVDIQSLPKTQPSRVMAKVQAAAEASGKKYEPSPPTSPKAEEGLSAKLGEDESKPNRKKTISLLDSYFKGL